MYSSESDFYKVISWGGSMEGWKLTSPTGLAFWMGIESSSVAGARRDILVVGCCIPEPSWIWQHTGWEVLCGICNGPGIISRHSICSPNVVGASAAATSSGRYLTTCGTLQSDMPYFLSVFLTFLAASSHPGCVNWSIVIYFCRNLSMRCCSMLDSVPITHPGSSSSLIFPCSVPSSSSSSPSSPLSDLARSLRLSPITTIISWSVLSGSMYLNPTFSAFLVSSCSCWTAGSGSSTHNRAPVVYPFNIILDTFLSLFIAWEVRFSLFLHCMLVLGSEATPCPKGSDSFQFQANLAFIRLMKLLGGPLCRFTTFARWKWLKLLFRSIDHCCLRWLCCCMRCWMWQDMDNMAASCVFYVKVGMFNHFEQSKISLLTVNKLGIVRLILQHDLIVSVSFK